MKHTKRSGIEFKRETQQLKVYLMEFNGCEANRSLCLSMMDRLSDILPTNLLAT